MVALVKGFPGRKEMTTGWLSAVKRRSIMEGVANGSSPASLCNRNPRAAGFCVPVYHASAPSLSR
jgi:hypothetical protein